MEFKLTDKEIEEANEFKAEHKKCGENMASATEGKYQFTYMFTPNGFGHLTQIKCNGCGKVKDITDTSHW